MSRNFKKEYIQKLRAIETKNGYKIDLLDYLRNPSLSHEYPGLQKRIEATEETLKISRVYYQKYYNGGGDYMHQILEAPKNADGWTFCKEVSNKTLESSNRFNLNRLIKLAEEMEA